MRTRPFAARFLAPAVLLCAAAFPAQAQVNHRTNITLAQMYANGVPVAYGVVCAVPADAYGNPITFSEQTWGVITRNSQFCGNVVSGGISGGITVPDANQTNLAAPIDYNFTLQLTTSAGVPTSQPITLYNSVPGVAGTTFVLDNYAPTVSTVVPPSNTFGYGSGVPSTCTAPSIWTVPGSSTILTCNAGVYVAPTGTGVNIGTTAGTVAAGNDARILNSIKNQGAWNTLVAYSANDFVSVGAANYISLTPGIGTNQGNAPGSSPSAWQLVGGGVSFAVGTVTTGSTPSVTITGGPLSYLLNFVFPAGSGGSSSGSTSYAGSLVFADTSNGNYYSLSVASVARRETQVSTSTALTTTPTVLIDTVSGTHYQLQFSGGAFQWAPVANSVAGVPNIVLTDTVSGSHWSLAITSAALTETASS